jgi:hypothetical protein
LRQIVDTRTNGGDSNIYIVEGQELTAGLDNGTHLSRSEAVIVAERLAEEIDVNISNPNDCEHDLNNNGKIETMDLMIVLQNWSEKIYKDKTWTDSAVILMQILTSWGMKVNDC